MFLNGHRLFPYMAICMHPSSLLFGLPLPLPPPTLNNIPGLGGGGKNHQAYVFSLFLDSFFRKKFPKIKLLKLNHILRLFMHIAKLFSRTVALDYMPTSSTWESRHHVL